MGELAARALLSICGVALITGAAALAVPGNPTTVGFAYLLLVLLVASNWGFAAAAIGSVAATLAFNFFFLPPVHTFTIADPQNWIALFSFLATSLIASRLSDIAERRALEAVNRQKDIERLYTFSRAILLIDQSEPVAKQLAQKIADTFGLSATVLFDRRTGEFYRAGPSDFEGMDAQLREAALNGTSFEDPEHKRVIAAVRLGSEPIASFALQGEQIPDSVLQGIANLTAIGLERAKAQELAHEIEAVRQSEQLRTTLIDAMAHEFKTPLTSIKAATTSLLAGPEQPAASRAEILKIADEEADRLKDLIDNSIEMARLDTAQFDVQLERSSFEETVRDAIAALRHAADDRTIAVEAAPNLPLVALDRRVMKIAIKQLIENALKYSPPDSPVLVRLQSPDGRVTLEVTDHGKGIPEPEQSRIFNRFYRSPSVQKQIPGTGLGLTIAQKIVQAHSGELTVSSRPGETTFRMSLPAEARA